MPSLQHTNVQMDNFLFSDDESLSQARPAAAVSRIDDDIVPDSSDEASTGPALEMPEMDLDREEGDDEELSYIAQQDENSYAHADASSNTRKGVFTTHPRG